LSGSEHLYRQIEVGKKVGIAGFEKPAKAERKKLVWFSCWALSAEQK
jgi:hypothetical protein